MSNQVEGIENSTNETVTDEGIVMNMDNVNEFTKDEIREEIRRYNESNNLAPSDENYVKLTGTKGDLVKRFGEIVGEFEMVEQDAAEAAEEEIEAAPEDDEEEVEEEHSSPDTASLTERKHLVLKWGQIRRNPLNPRHDEDYYDNNLIRLIAKDKGISDALVVRPAGEVDEDGNEIYYPVSGNRRHFNLGEAIRQQDRLVEEGVIDEPFYAGELEDFPVDAMLRETEGDETALVFDELKTLVNLNESSWPLSPVDKYNAMSKMLSLEGVTQQDVADALDVSKQYVSKMQGFSDVPEFILDYVHYGHNAERFASTRTVEELKEAGIPFVELEKPDENGNEVQVLGITMNNALAIAATLRRVLRESDEGESEVRESFRTFLVNSSKEWAYRTESGEGVLSAAIAMSENQFKSFLQEAAEEFGLFPEEEEETKTLETTSGSDESDVQETSSDDEGRERQKEEPTPDFFAELASDIEGGKFRLNPDISWERILADDLRFGSEDAKAAFNWMLDANLITKA